MNPAGGRGPGGALAAALICPDCRRAPDARSVCPECGRDFAAVDGIRDLLPRAELPPPPAAADPHFLKYHAELAASADYFYRNPNPLLGWLKGGGHRLAAALAGAPETGLTLELGCGTGEHLRFHPGLEPARCVLFDRDRESLLRIPDRERYAGVIRGDSGRLPFADGAFHLVLSISHLEHLWYLDWTLAEVRRVLHPAGRFVAAVPTEGRRAWGLGRQLTTARHYGRKLGIDFARANRVDHCNTFDQVERALRRYFAVRRRAWSPFPVGALYGAFELAPGP